MKLTLHTDYALRMLVFLAVREGRSTTVSDMAKVYRLSRNHLMKVALDLGRLDYIKTTRGRSGGISLARRPSEINVGEVIRAMEDGFALVECLGPGGGSCLITPACRLKGVVRRALEAFLAVLDAYTLADLIGERTLLEELLEIQVDPAKAA
ncbi:MAG: Rrf2 family transcriptional regulator [Rhizobiaceae bacterium]|jgi:Rrf2 family nitric oxide-sensitive transcriptional repressor